MTKPKLIRRFTDEELFAIMVMCEGSIPNCVYAQVTALCKTIREHLDPENNVRGWLSEAERRHKERKGPDHE